MALRGIRGAITIAQNSKKEIVLNTKKLLEQIFLNNKVKADDICAIIFSATVDLDAEFPAVAARELGLLYTPLLCANEMPVKGALKKCVRVLLLINSNTPQKKIKHIYLGGAKKLRPDLKELISQ